MTLSHDRLKKMKNIIMILIFIILVPAASFVTGCGGVIEGPRTATVNLTWDAPSQNADGTTLIDIAGYRVYFGETPLTYPNSVMIFGTGTSASIGNLHYDRTVYFAVAAYNIYGYLSSYSNEFQITLPK
jgi:hypothetical protein